MTSFHHPLHRENADEERWADEIEIVHAIEAEIGFMTGCFGFVELRLNPFFDARDGVFW